MAQSEASVESNAEVSTDFREYVSRHLTRGVDGYGQGKNYITYPALTHYWTTEQLDQLLLSFTPPLVLPTDKILRSYIRILSLLVYISKVGNLSWFVTQEQDDHLWARETAPRSLPGGTELSTPFHEERWMFFPYEFTQVPFLKHLDARCILPITIQGSITPPTTDRSVPTVQKVVLNGIRNRSIQTDDKVVVFKTYRGIQARPLWENEAKTFQAITQQSKCDFVVECLGSFWQEQEHDEIYTIILEHANGGTLLDLFEADKPPIKHEDRVKFWENLFSLLKGLTRIHGLQVDGTRGLRSLSCIHLDIKPANILVFQGNLPGPHNCTFKLADFGSSPMRMVITGQVMKAEDTGGTPMYSPPECCRDFRYLADEFVPATWAYDIWSLGCVFSEALVWTTLRQEGRQNYELRRIEATNGVRRLTDAGYSGCFHNVESRLVVVDAVQKEAQQVYNDDKITAVMSELILRRMLRKDIRDRPSSDFLYRLFKEEVAEKIKPPANLPGPKPAPAPAPVPGPQPGFQDDYLTLADKKSKTWSSGKSSTEEMKRPRSPMPIHPKPVEPDPEPKPPAKKTEAAKSPVPRIQLPDVTVSDVNTWRAKEGGGAKRLSRLLGVRQKQEIDGIEYVNQLFGRDQIFLIDDCPTMAKHKQDVIQTFQALAWLVKRTDKNGMDMYFMSEPATPHNNPNSGPLVTALEKHRSFGFCNFKHSLDKMADLIINKNVSWRSGDPVSLFILTDGDWGLQGDTLGEVDKTIGRIVDALKRNNKASTFVALQFVRFGDLPDGIKRLRKLDNLKKNKILDMDIVDHSSSKDSVWKMLIGSLVEGVDDDSDDEAGGPG